MSKETSQWYKLQYPECFINDEQRMIQGTVSDFVDKEIMPVRHIIDDDQTHEEVVEPILKKLQIDLGCQTGFRRRAIGIFFRLPTVFRPGLLLVRTGKALEPQKNPVQKHGVLHQVMEVLLINPPISKKSPKARAA